MKKFFIFLLILIITVANVPYLALGANEPELETVTPEYAKPGDEISVDVIIRNNPGIMVMILGIDYDSTRLEFTGFKDGVFKGWQVHTNAVWVGDGDIDADGTILTLNFRVLDNAAPGETRVAVTCAEGNIANYNEEIIMPELIAGSINILSDETSADTPDVPDTPDTDEPALAPNETGAEIESEENGSDDEASDENEITEPDQTEPEKPVSEETEDTESQPVQEENEDGFQMRLIAIIVVGAVIVIAIIAVLIRGRRA